MKKNETTVTMKEFRDNIGSDEQMLEFAASNLDLPDDAKVRITIAKKDLTFSAVTFEVLETPMPCVHELGEQECLVGHLGKGQCRKCVKCHQWVEQA